MLIGPQAHGVPAEQGLGRAVEERDAHIGVPGLGQQGHVSVAAGKGPGAGARQNDFALTETWGGGS